MTNMADYDLNIRFTMFDFVDCIFFTWVYNLFIPAMCTCEINSYSCIEVGFME